LANDWEERIHLATSYNDHFTHFHEVERPPDEDQDEEVWEEERPASAFVRGKGESPNVA